MPIISLLLVSTTEPPTPCQLQARAWRCGIVMSLCNILTDAEKGALGVGVNVGVTVGVINERDVADGSSVMVGNKVAVTVALKGVAVHVGSSWRGVMVGVGMASNFMGLGGSRFMGELGNRKSKTKYTPTHIVISKVRRLSTSHNSRRELCFGAGGSL